MAHLLTLVAEEICNTVALIWGGVSIAVKLNYEIITYLLKTTTNIVQTLLLLIRKVTDGLVVISSDTVLFLEDVGSGFLSTSKMLGILISEIVNVIFSFSSYASSIVAHCTLFYYYIINGVHYAVSYIVYFIFIIKSAVILFGSSIFFIITLVPNMLSILYKSIIQLILNIWINSFERTVYLYREIKCSVHVFYLYIHNNLQNMPLSSVIGAFIGITLLFSLKYLLHYLCDMSIISEDFSVPSLTTKIKQKILGFFDMMLLRFFLSGNDVDDSDERILDNSDHENGNDANANVPNLNIHQEPEMAAEQNIINNSSRNEENFAASNGHSNIFIGTSHLTRQPLTRRQRLLWLMQNCTEDETHLTGHKKEMPCDPRNAAWVKQLYKELEEERENRICVICQERPKCIILLPCRHLCLCDACSSSVIRRDNNCPLCRQAITDTLRVYN